MTQEFDPRKSYLAVKSNEKMIAFVSFVIQPEKSGDSKEGVVKISSFQRPYGGGYLTLTFIVDIEQDEQHKKHLQRLCDNITEDSLRPFLGQGFERMVKVSLDLLEEIKGWFIEEINVHFRSIDGREKVLIEEKLIPALEGILRCTFDPVEWWPVQRNIEAAEDNEIEKQVSLRTLFKKWFGAS